jgi:hypothetical protein
MPVSTWKLGDRIRHAQKPEWGVGRVVGVEIVQLEGRASQRLRIQFDRAGVKTIIAGLAELEPAPAGWTGHAVRPEPDAPEDGGSVTESFGSKPEQSALREMLIKIPEAASDPFTTHRKRLEATLGLYRFSDKGGLLLDWACMQTGLKDPLTKFSRHELEQSFQRFQHNLDQHLKKLIKECRRADNAMLLEVAAAATPAAKLALRRADMDR